MFLWEFKLMAKKSKLATRVAELEAAVAGLFTGTPAAPARKRTRAKSRKAKAVKKVKTVARKTKKAAKKAVKKAKRAVKSR